VQPLETAALLHIAGRFHVRDQAIGHEAEGIKHRTFADAVLADHHGKRRQWFTLSFARQSAQLHIAQHNRIAPADWSGVIRLPSK